MANMTRFGPLAEMMTLREAMNNLLEESFVPPTAGRGQALTMPLDVAETADAFIVEASLPGIKPEDLDITLENNVLTISGEVRQEHSSGEKPNYHRIERRYGRVQRSISLPTQVAADQVQATLNNGILRLEVPKAETVKPRKITVSGGGQQQPIDVSPERGQAQGS